jgi:cell wall-associated NlpC family hydrolase
MTDSPAAFFAALRLPAGLLPVLAARWPLRACDVLPLAPRFNVRAEARASGDGVSAERRAEGDLVVPAAGQRTCRADGADRSASRIDGIERSTTTRWTMTSQQRALALALLLPLIPSAAAQGHATAAPSPVASALEVPDAAFDARYWIARWPDAERVALDARAVAARNAILFERDASVTRLEALPASIAVGELRERVLARSSLAGEPRYFTDGGQVTEADRRRWLTALNLDAFGNADEDRRPLGWALVTRRAPLRTFPTLERIFAAPGDTDLDRFQESALFPGTPVAVLHASADDRWRFVVAATYAAWIPEGVLAHTERETALAFAAGATRTVLEPVATLAHTPDAPNVSNLALDMGVALPERRDGPLSDAVNGQGALASHIVDVPTRDPNGRLLVANALLPRSEATHDGPLPASRANLLRQAFRFLGERYGWGHDHGARDCSGFVSEVYRSIGIVLPRNTVDQARSPAAAERTPLPATWTRAQRLAALGMLQPGDLVYLPGHVVMVIGHDERGPWVIHDVHRLRLSGEGDALVPLPANGVVLTPLLPLRFDATRDYVDAATVLVRVLPRDDRSAIGSAVP